MRFVGLTLALLASSFGARADSVENRVSALEARMKALEETLRAQDAKPPAPAAAIDGEYRATLPNGSSVILTFDKSKVTATSGGETQSGTYEIIGHRVVISADGKTESLKIDGNVLHGGNANKTIDFTKSK